MFKHQNNPVDNKQNLKWEYVLLLLNPTLLILLSAKHHLSH